MWLRCTYVRVFITQKSDKNKIKIVCCDSDGTVYVNDKVVIFECCGASKRGVGRVSLVASDQACVSLGGSVCARESRFHAIKRPRAVLE